MSVGAWAPGRVIVAPMCECVLSGRLQLGMRCEKTREPKKNKWRSVRFAFHSHTLSWWSRFIFSSTFSDWRQTAGWRVKLASPPRSAQHRNGIFTSTYLYNTNK